MPERDCPNQCAANEEYDRCFHGCEPTCDQPNPVIDCSSTITHLYFTALYQTMRPGRMSMLKRIREGYNHKEMCGEVNLSQSILMNYRSSYWSTHKYCKYNESPFVQLWSVLSLMNQTGKRVPVIDKLLYRFYVLFYRHYNVRYSMRYLTWTKFIRLYFLKSALFSKCTTDGLACGSVLLVCSLSTWLLFGMCPLVTHRLLAIRKMSI